VTASLLSVHPFSPKDVAGEWERCSLRLSQSRAFHQRSSNFDAGECNVNNWASLLDILTSCGCHLASVPSSRSISGVRELTGTVRMLVGRVWRGVLKTSRHSILSVKATSCSCRRMLGVYQCDVSVCPVVFDMVVISSIKIGDANRRLRVTESILRIAVMLNHLR
jgi:hypothetical protein